MATFQTDYYEVLGVLPTATADEIRNRYRFLVLAFHPDRFSRNSEHHALAEQQIKRVNEAYRILADTATRAQFDATRRSALPAGDLAKGSRSSALYAQTLQEMAQAVQRARRLEQELAASHEQIDALRRAHDTLEQQLRRQQRMWEQERQSLQTTQQTLTSQLEQLTRERFEVERSLQQQVERLQARARRLAQEVERKERTIERLKSAKQEWEQSSQSRLALLEQQVQRLRDDLATRDGQLATVRSDHISLQSQIQRETNRARTSSQQYASALHASETEAARLQLELDALEAGQQRNRQVQRLWQIAAAIGLANTLILLALALQRLSGG
ncbi:MAG: DnaJ domain-containing protein [Caldilineaceae bacterium]|nr:DnaJ domain-containing protein [Caldilineaceae bacterium]